MNVIEAIGEPKNKAELLRLLGMLRYLQKFVPNLAEKTATLRKLSKHEGDWLWTEEQSSTFKEIK